MPAEKPDYTLLDNALLSHVRAGKTQFYELNGGRLAEFANKIAGKNRRGDPQGWRLLDRRLQALRKAGRLTYDRKAGWALAAGVTTPSGVERMERALKDQEAHFERVYAADGVALPRGSQK